MGANCWRTTIYLYWADKLGLLVWEEMPSAYRFNPKAITRIVREWTEAIERDYSHPCVIVWVRTLQRVGLLQFGPRFPGRQEGGGAGRRCARAGAGGRRRVAWGLARALVPALSLAGTPALFPVLLRARLAERFDTVNSLAEDGGMETRIAALEATVESIGKALDDLRCRVDNGFRDLRSEIRDVRIESKNDMRDLRKDVDARFRWMVGIQIATFLAVLGVLARVAHLV